MCNDCGILIKTKAWKIALSILCNDCGIQYGGFLIIKNRFSVLPSYTTPGYLPKGFKVNTSKILAHRCLLQHCSWQLSYGTSLRTQQQRSGEGKCGFYTWWNFLAIRNQVMLLKEKWKQLETTILSDLSQFQKDKCQIFSLACSSCILYRYIEIMNEYMTGKRKQKGK